MLFCGQDTIERFKNQTTRGAEWHSNPISRLHTINSLPRLQVGLPTSAGSLDQRLWPQIRLGAARSGLDDGDGGTKTKDEVLLGQNNRIHSPDDNDPGSDTEAGATIIDVRTPHNAH